MAAKTSSTRTAPKAPRATTKKAVATTIATSARSVDDGTVFGFPLTSWVGSARRPRGNEIRSGKRAFVLAFGSRDSRVLKSALKEHLNRWQMQLLAESDQDVYSFQGANGPLWVLRVPPQNMNAGSTAALEKSGYARFRDLIGPVVTQLQSYGSERLIVETFDLGNDETKGLLVGLEMASYFYQEHRGLSKRTRRRLPALLLKSANEAFDQTGIDAAATLGVCINLARHLVNVPPNDLNPRTYSEVVESLFSGSRVVETEVWEGEKLKSERMNLLLAVGQAASEGPRLVHLRYRPEGVAAGIRPIAIVGKGITFDSGGLDIKPASGMRWMKKDMGGSAAVVAIAKWAELTKLKHPIDFYLSLAENAIGDRAFRPGDVLTARSGMTVEIQNTDAEGRLVLADAFDVAVNQEGEDAPAGLINLATLTGANKVALGAEIAGLYSNNDELATKIFEASLMRGDLAWRIPLYQPYRGALKSTFADCQNSADGFGGAITAALFLESFTKKVPFAHLDIYSWKDGASGAYSESGGNGQGVQMIAEVLSRLEMMDRVSEGAVELA